VLECPDRGTLRFNETPSCSPGDTVYLVSRRRERAALTTPRRLSVAPVKIREQYPAARKLFEQWNRGAPSPGPVRECLWVKVDDPAWLDLLHGSPCQRLVLACERDVLERFLDDSERLRVWRSRLLLALPPFCTDSQTASWKHLISLSMKAGIRGWACTNLAHTALFKKTDFHLFADTPVWALNRIAQDVLARVGYEWFAYSPEDDYLNMRNAAAPSGVACLFGRIALFISRIRPSLTPGAICTDPRNNRFEFQTKYGLHYLLSSQPLSLVHRKAKLAEAGIRNFLLDLCWYQPDSALLGELLDSLRSGCRKPGSLFNFKAGLK
jgi:hypothetical protein